MPALKPPMPTGYYRVFGGIATSRVGRTLLTAETGTAVTVWDADTGLRVVDLINDDGSSPTTATVVSANSVIEPVGIPVSVLRPLFQVGDSGVFLPPGSDSPSALTLDVAQSAVADAEVARIQAEAAANRAEAASVGGAVARGELFISAADYDTIPQAVAAAPSGGTVYLPAGNYPTPTVTIDKPLTITGPGILAAEGLDPVLSITSSGVNVLGVKITGPGIAGTLTDSSKAILAVGTLASPLADLVIDGCTITGFAHSAIYVEFATDAKVTRNTIRDMLYGGIFALTWKGGLIDSNLVSNVVQKAPAVNTYGIAITDNVNTIAGRCTDVVVSNNVIRYVRDWEGIDTHGARNVTITGNTIVGCRDGIAAVAGNASRVCAPENTTIVGNSIDSTGANSPRSGIRLIGVNSTTKASGVVLSNSIRGAWGTDPVETSYFDVDKTQFDEWVQWTPTWAGLTVGDGTQVCRYTRVGDTVTAQVILTLGATSAVSGLFDFTLPVALNPDFYVTYSALGAASLVDASAGGSGRYAASALVLSMSGRAYFVTGNTQVSNTAPFTWAVGDKITCTITYEAAPVTS